MSNSRFRKILKDWADDASEREDLEQVTISVKRSDLCKLQALTELYDQPLESITAEMLHAAIQEVEVAMPYVAGEKVIRVEDGMEVFEDVGPTPRYLDLVKKGLGEPD